MSEYCLLSSFTNLNLILVLGFGECDYGSALHFCMLHIPGMRAVARVLEWRAEGLRSLLRLTLSSGGKLLLLLMKNVEINCSTLKQISAGQHRKKRMHGKKTIEKQVKSKYSCRSSGRS